MTSVLPLNSHEHSPVVHHAVSRLAYLITSAQPLFSVLNSHLCKNLLTNLKILSSSSGPRLRPVQRDLGKQLPVFVLLLHSLKMLTFSITIPT